MSDTQTITDPARLEEVLAQLRSLMDQQTQCLAREDFDEFTTLGDAVAQQLEQVSKSQSPMTWECLEHVREIHGLHYSLGLTLATKSKETAEHLTKMRSGRNVLKAYSNA